MTIRTLVYSCALFHSVLHAGTTVLFQPSLPAVGPFPTNALTVAAPSEKTGIQVAMPTSSCANPTLSSCINAQLLNQLDGFSVNSQIVVCFSGPVQVGTLQAAMQIYPVTKSPSGIAINQILYDQASNCMFAKPDQVLAQQSQYLLAITNSVLDGSGNKVTADPGFTTCLKGGTTYCKALENAVSEVGLNSGLVSASLFTTMSTTDWVEKAYTLVSGLSSPDIAALPAGSPTQFSLSQLSGISWIPDYGKTSTGGAQPTTPQPIPLSDLSGVDSVAFGLYLSPNFVNVSGLLAGMIAVTPTGGPIAGPVSVGATGFPPGFVPVSYHVFLPPARYMPPGGFPVAIYGHGLGDSQFGAPSFIASTLASAGIATLAIEILGHGFGPGGTVELTYKNNQAPSFVSTPGRGIQFSTAAPIGETDGCIAPGAIGVRDCTRQSAVDLFAMVKTIQATKGLGVGLNPSRIYYIGQSFGSIYGTLYHAIEPASKAAVLNVGGGTSVAVSRLAPLGRILAAEYLGTNNPVLLNVPPAPPEPYFHDSFNDLYVYRNTPPVLNYTGAAGTSVLAVDNALELADWLDMIGDPLGFAFELQNQQLPGLIGKSTLVQFAYGDLEVPNPTNSALIRAAGLQSSSWYFRFDKAAALHPELLSVAFGSPLPALPHAYLSNPTLFTGIAAEDSIAIAAQQQVAVYLGLGGLLIPNPNWFLNGVFAGQTLFEIPTTLPEQLNFIQIQP